MRAIVKSSPGPGCDFVIDRAEHELQLGQVRIEVAAASVCGSDAAFYARGDAGGDLGMTFPRTMGHEMGGTVVETGPHVTGLRVGDRVAVETHMHCGACWFCRNGLGHNCADMGILGVTVDGAFAERVVVPARSCYHLPEQIDAHVAALLESGGSAVHGVLRAGRNVMGASVLVSGGGPVGLVAAQTAKAAGAREVAVVEPNIYRRKLADSLGFLALDVDADAVASAGATTRARGGYDLVLECSGALPALRAAITTVRREGVVVAIGLPKTHLELNVTETLIMKGVTLLGSWGRSIWETWERLTALVVAGQVDLDSLITHRLPISELPLALDLMRGEAGKVLLVPSMRDRA